MYNALGSHEELLKTLVDEHNGFGGGIELERTSNGGIFDGHTMSEEWRNYGNKLAPRTGLTLLTMPKLRTRLPTRCRQSRESSPQLETGRKGQTAQSPSMPCPYSNEILQAFTEISST
ncbi:hypothetical protein AC579_6522 [Pseudocercospora musae]|uniref:Uncharacterized protein n=1 Tax=Pseudocercospora musae TaxID=113226 RepID=A0A139I3P8_9PEZI|nr:hypothetical protein AC579_6522 [Pseudocercospora musae]